MSRLNFVGMMAVGAASFVFAAGTSFARGGGQGEHEADSGGAVQYYGRGGNGGYNSGGVGQGQEGPGGSSGSYVYSGINGQGVGQAQHEAGGGSLQALPAIQESPLMEQGTMVAGSPENGYRVAGDSNYRYANGMWFYQLGNDRWVRWENGGWRNYNSAIAQQDTGESVSRTFSYDPSQTNNKPNDAKANDHTQKASPAPKSNSDKNTELKHNSTDHKSDQK